MDAEPSYADDGPDLVCGQISFEELGSGLGEDHEPLFHEWAKERRSRDKILNIFGKAKSIVTVQVINNGGDPDVYEESIEPLWDWLIENRQGLLIAEGGDFYDKSGLIE